MRVRLATSLVSLGGQITFLPFMVGAFTTAPAIFDWLCYGVGTICFVAYALVRRNDAVRLHESIVTHELMAFYGRYPWRPAATALLVLFGILVVSFGNSFAFTASEVSAMGLAIWGLSSFVGEVVFGGRRSGAT